VIHIPTPEEFERLTQAPDGPAQLSIAAQRDIARMVELVHLVDEKFLGENAVLSGGMAMRLRGSRRLTMLDTDLSASPAADVKPDDIRDVLEVQTDEITIVPDGVRPKVELIQAFPVRFVFAQPPAPASAAERVFKVDLSLRGFVLPPEWLELRHDYPFELGIEGTPIPTMALIEAVAEKTVSFGIFRTAKHYADLAFVSDRFSEVIAASEDTLREVTTQKFRENTERFPRKLRDQGITDYSSMKASFDRDYYLRGVKATWSAEVKYLGAPAEAYTFAQAKQLVTERLVPIVLP
jgi:hypothetical protein